jgi:hypothetical protein
VAVDWAQAGEATADKSAATTHGRKRVDVFSMKFLLHAKGSVEKGRSRPDGAPAEGGPVDDGLVVVRDYLRDCGRVNADGLAGLTRSNERPANG